MYAEIERSGIFLVVLEAHVKYRRGALYDDVLQVKATLKEIPTLRITIDYEITRNGGSEILVTGQTVHAFTNAQTGRPIRPPQEYMNIMQRYFPL